MTLLPQIQPGDAAPSADEAWRVLLRTLTTYGRPVAPRGQQTAEVLHHVSLTVDLNRPVIVCPERNLNYRFMATEALWIADGLNDLATLARVNPRMAKFSDDGQVLAGAYGPRIRPQVPYVVKSLLRDKDTRQAALTIWTPSPEPSKDIPCTVAMVFSIRNGHLYQHVFMRSSDAWLGIPYDIFSFSVLAMEIACQYNIQVPKIDERIALGHMTITCTSSHLYAKDHVSALIVLETANIKYENTPVVNSIIIQEGWWSEIVWRIEACKNRAPGENPRYPI